jgi:hypothetical protein
VVQLLLGGYKTVVVDNLDNSSNIALKRVRELAGENGSNLTFHKVCSKSLQLFPPLYFYPVSRFLCDFEICGVLFLSKVVIFGLLRMNFLGITLMIVQIKVDFDFVGIFLHVLSSFLACSSFCG